MDEAGNVGTGFQSKSNTLSRFLRVQLQLTKKYSSSHLMFKSRSSVPVAENELIRSDTTSSAIDPKSGVETRLIYVFCVHVASSNLLIHEVVFSWKKKNIINFKPQWGRFNPRIQDCNPSGEAMLVPWWPFLRQNKAEYSEKVFLESSFWALPRPP